MPIAGSSETAATTASAALTPKKSGQRKKRPGVISFFLRGPVIAGLFGLAAAALPLLFSRQIFPQLRYQDWVARMTETCRELPNGFRASTDDRPDGVMLVFTNLRLQPTHPRLPNVPHHFEVLRSPRLPLGEPDGSATSLALLFPGPSADVVQFLDTSAVRGVTYYYTIRVYPNNTDDGRLYNLFSPVTVAGFH